MIDTTSCVALVGAGKGGKALLVDLIKIPGVTIKYVCDVNMQAEGILFAEEQGIKTCSWDEVDTILNQKPCDQPYRLQHYKDYILLP
ncbi:MAG: hypothetical protein ACYTFY_22055 [Planctomycetota bacterium]